MKNVKAPLQMAYQSRQLQTQREACSWDDAGANKHKKR